jgi:hypothetical protein
VFSSNTDVWKRERDALGFQMFGILSADVIEANMGRL